jgi:hypothetical protein
LKYSVDTSAIIEGWIRDFPPDVAPHAWMQIEESIDDGVLVASEEVLIELEKKHDKVYKWACQRKHMFVPTDEKIQEAAKSILRNHKKLIDARKNRSGADPFVIALAVVKRLTVVTAENPSVNPEKPKIPNVCEALGIRWLNMVELFREEGWHF